MTIALVLMAAVSLGIVFGSRYKSPRSRLQKKDIKARSDFIANVSHELRTPLTSIQGYAELLQQDLQDSRIDAAKESAQAIARNTKRLLDICSDLLVLSKYENSPEILSREFTKASDLVNEAMAVLSQKHKDKNYEVKIFHGDHTVFCQKSKIIQVVVNLADNAIRYLPAHGQIHFVFSKYKTQPSDESQKYVYADKAFLKMNDSGSLITVKDNGPGIERNHLERIFERFYRVDKGRSRETGGTGLGLAIVKHILELHGGWIRVSSDPGMGASFDCFLPDPHNS